MLPLSIILFLYRPIIPCHTSIHNLIQTAIRHTAAIASLLFYSPRTQRFLSYCQVPSGMVSIVCDLWHTARLEELLLKGQEIVVAPTIWIPIRVRIDCSGCSCHG